MQEQPIVFSTQLDHSVDQDAELSDPQERAEKSREAKQAHGFRESVFYWIGLLCFFVSMAWFWLLANCPENTAPKEAFYLWGAKVSLCTLVLVSLTVGLLRFAINCYGHHKPTPENGVSASSAASVGKVIEAVGKAFQSHSS